MIKMCFVIGVAAMIFVAGCSFIQCPCQKDESILENSKEDIMLAHNVYFTLKDDSESAKKTLVDACYKYLKDHPGVEFFAAGTIAEELDRPVNDRDFHVALHVVFENQGYQDRYQTAARHLQFIEENKENWVKVRVFDSVVR